MSIYHRKLLELEDIFKKSDKYYLHIRLSFEQDIEMFWEIDECTAENLKTITNFDKKYKYRLSFNNSWDVVQKQHISTLTRTYREQSDRIYFQCSEDYLNKLVTIKNIQHISDLDKLTFISMNLAPILEQQDEDKQEQDEKALHKKNNSKFRLTSVAVMSLIFVVLFSCFNYVYLNETIFNEKVLAQSIHSDNEMDSKQNEHLDLKKDTLVDNVSYNQSTIPFVELDQAITYNIPKGNVALTFDDGPSRYSVEIMDVLKEYGVGGTFFFTGSNVTKYPDYVKYIQSNGYSIGSHSMNHHNMPTLSYEKQEIELIQSIKLLEEITNSEITLFRPPYGSFNNYVKDLTRKNQYKIVLWNNDPKDWQVRDKDKIFNDIQSSNVSGSIILLHESQAVIDALPKIIEYLQELDLQIVNLQ